MKPRRIVLMGMVLFSLLLSSAHAFADSQPLTDDTKKSTPAAQADHGNGNSDAKATERATRADERSTQRAGRATRANYRGRVTEVTDGSLTLALADGSSITFAVTEATHVKIPTLGSSADLSAVNPGVNAAVRAQQGSDGAWTALSIHVVPGKPERVHRVGVVTAYTPGESITVQAKDGNSSTFLLTANTKILPSHRADQLAVGSLVTVISRRDVTGGPLTAQGIVVHPQKQEGDGVEGSQTPESSPTPSPTPTDTPTPTPSPSPTPTSTPTMTATPTATETQEQD